ncbi:fibronectin type III domain-containing protein, partial [bacterium]|nr:fibronectin type III domain-containing protein [bacterium]
MVGSDSPFRTNDESDIDPPVIESGPDGTIITANTATIEWKTNESTYGLLKYGEKGLGMPYEIRTSEYSFEQKIDLIDLKTNIEYEYTVYVYDKAENETKSKLVKTFKTLHEEDTTPPLLGEGPVVDFQDRSGSFYWKTDEVSDSYVFYKIAGSAEEFAKVGFPDMLLEHNVIVTDLEPGTDYWFVVSSTDYNFNTMAVYPKDFTGDSTLFKLSKTLKINQPPGGTGRFRTRTIADVQVPIIISGPVVTNVSKSTVTIQWVTNENSNSFVNFGTADELSLSKGTSFNVTEHEITLTNLDSATTYKYKVSSTDLSNNGPSLSKSAAFTTLNETDIIPPVIEAGPVIVSITDKEATVMWTTDEPSDSYVEFGFDSTFGEADAVIVDEDTLYLPTYSKSLSEDEEEHKITLTNLLVDTLYYYRIASVDIEENGPT